MPRPTFANVTSLLALVVALGGTSYAVAALPPGSVGTQQLKADAVTTAKVKNRSLLAKDFKTGQLPRGERGPAGPAGPFTSALPSGKTMRGDFYLAEGDATSGQYVTASISWGLTVEPSPTVEVRQEGSAATAHCPGTAERPTAAPGFACIYVRLASGLGATAVFGTETASQSVHRYGAALYTAASTSGFVQGIGTWAVTAP